MSFWFQFQDAPADQVGGAAAAGIGVGFMVVWFAVVLLMVAAMWKVFVKAGKPGWAAIVPIYNIIVLLEICNKPAWWVVLFLIPFVNVVIAIMLCISLAKKFGHGVGYGLGLAFLGVIFMPMLGFGNSQYDPSAAA
ncbi:MAG TPA: DUF5684 domain-containing protein [Thermoanaerobaculia bacterium]|nr:DUF5684 domain-containing protein [Thermoanaerobaculia bacterium]